MGGLRGAVGFRLSALALALALALAFGCRLSAVAWLWKGIRISDSGLEETGFEPKIGEFGRLSDVKKAPLITLIAAR
jgi:hypothetical protein